MLSLILTLCALGSATAVRKHRPHQTRKRYQMPEANGGGSFSATININLDVNKLLSQIGRLIGHALDVNKNSRSNPSGGIWFNGVSGGVVYSAFYHPSRYHRTSVKPGRRASTFPTTKDWVAPGKWAITYTPASRFGGNRAYYSVR